MSIRSKYAFINGVVWFLVLIVLIVTFNANDYSSVDKVVGAVSQLLGFSVGFLLLIKSRKEVQDERVLTISNKSTSVSMILTLLYVFILCIALTEIHPQTVASSWFWFLGYSMICVANISASFLYLILEKTGNSYES